MRTKARHGAGDSLALRTVAPASLDSCGWDLWTARVAVVSRCFSIDLRFANSTGEAATRSDITSSIQTSAPPPPVRHARGDVCMA